jgi:hypothetical protein
MDVGSPEFIFSLAGRRGKLVELFYHTHVIPPAMAWCHDRAFSRKTSDE